MGAYCNNCSFSSPESELIDETPIILCNFECGNENQKNYLKELVTKFQLKVPLKYDIKSIGNVPFQVKLKIGKEIFDIQDTFDYSNIEESMQNAVNKCKEIFSAKGMI